MKKIIPVITGLLLLFSSMFIIAENQSQKGLESVTEKNILKAKERLKDRLLLTADEVIQKHLEALGGVTAIKSIKTMLVKGRSISLNQQERPLVRYYKQPDRFRQQVPGSLDFMFIENHKVYYARNGMKLEMKQPWTKSFRNQRIDGNFLDYGNRGVSYKYIGLKGLDTEPTVFYHLKRVFADGYTEDLYFDVDSGLLRMTGYKDYPDSYRMFYQYRDIGGILFPRISMRVFNRLTSPHVFVVDEVKINDSFEDGLFSVTKN